MFRFLYHLSIDSSPKTFILNFLGKAPLVKSISTTASTNHNSFTVSYLINSCGLPQEKAISASKLVKFETSAKADSVLNLFRNHEISDTQISKIIQAVPTLLVSNANKTVKPKIDFFKTLGLADHEIPKILCDNPKLLTSSLVNRIIPAIAYLKILVLTDENILLLLKRSTWVLTYNLQEVLRPNVEVLLAHGVPDHNIATLLVAHPRALLLNMDKFKNLAQEVMKLGFDPSKFMFCEGLRRLISMSESTREAKVGVYKKWGWSEDEIYKAFRKEPTCMGLSGETIMRKMDFFVNKMGYDPLLIAQYPAVLKFNLEEKIIPRARVIQILKSKGLLKIQRTLYAIFVIPDEEFVKKFVSKYEAEVPELVNAYQRKGECLEPYCAGV